jgi:hypothetical protein
LLSSFEHRVLVVKVFFVFWKKIPLAHHSVAPTIYIVTTALPVWCAGGMLLPPERTGASAVRYFGALTVGLFLVVLQHFGAANFSKTRPLKS